MGWVLYLLFRALFTSKRRYYTRAEFEHLRRQAWERDHGDSFFVDSLPASSKSDNFTIRR